MIESIGLIVAVISSIIAMLTSATTLYLWRRSRIADVKVKEIATADDMVDLINKVMERALAQMGKENEKFRKLVARFERAIQKIYNCPHRDSCPVSAELQSDSLCDGKTDYG